MPGLGYLMGQRIDCAKRAKIEKAVIERRQQRIREQMGKPHQIAVVRRRIDHQEIDRVSEAVNSGFERCKFLGFVVLQQRSFSTGDTAVDGGLQRKPSTACPNPPVLDIAREAFLIAIEIDRANGLAVIDKRDGDVHGERRLARASLLIADDNHMRRLLEDGRLLQHCNELLRLLHSGC